MRLVWWLIFRIVVISRTWLLDLTYSCLSSLQKIIECLKWFVTLFFSPLRLLSYKPIVISAWNNSYFEYIAIWVNFPHHVHNSLIKRQWEDWRKNVWLKYMFKERKNGYTGIRWISAKTTLPVCKFVPAEPAEGYRGPQCKRAINIWDMVVLGSSTPLIRARGHYIFQFNSSNPCNLLFELTREEILIFMFLS